MHDADAAGPTIDVGPRELDELLAGDLPVLADFWAAWCGPCLAMVPHVEAVAEKFTGRLVVARVDADAHPGLLERFRVQAIPTLLLFVGGEVTDEIVGAASAEDLAFDLGRMLVRVR